MVLCLTSFWFTLTLGFETILRQQVVLFEGKLDVIAHTLPWAPATSYFYWQRNRNQTFFLATLLRPRRKCYKGLIFL